MRRPFLPVALALGGVLLSPGLYAQDAPRLRGPEPFTRETPVPPMQRAVTNDVRVRRNYPDQPPLIPHAIEGYALDLNANKCMSCHARRFTEQSQAPMISVTHYQDREGNTLGGLAPRRYACLSCHVPQTEARPLVESRFRDMDQLTEPERRGGADRR
ncbi:Periplasmic nitrate reductase, electron transfer subunit [Rhodovastum atsumiense]|uniref:Periplasmic nitrate reductase, electron transfer subunit n=1 Tax=Rhodovastum atsumiense TaxID=504468 RepID=A0A5M6IPN0_9PROT|nr:nitrate reductase cytochrome c-type subunit [Rhodovastum atsumiense]KAA5609425.1 nitrate reductase cytochrome c-type subunit [Rhodovastum atsumiense]CAH2601811.1 Periplasmic nitrate reductase, electron transfer subunit [Rhodovastum atsumiense]